jgi:uncharacterized secreted protein with C-terminal beta-propeller domain
MRSFGSEQELARFLRELAEKNRRGRREGSEWRVNAAPTAETVWRSKMPRRKDEESITNVQHAGVDEGGIVKVHGDHLVVLRRGRLFTIAIGDGALKPIRL